MSALDSFNPQAITVVKLLASVFRSAPTADIVADGAAFLRDGGTAAGLLNHLFGLNVPLSPFTAYAGTTSNATFAQALVANLADGAGVSAAKQAAWAAELTPLVGQYASRGDFVVAILAVMQAYQGADVDLLNLKALQATRAETAAAFALSPAGAVYDGQGFAQLLAPLAAPSYQLSANLASVNEGGSLTLTLVTTNVAAGTSVPYALSGTGITAADFAGGQLLGNLVIDSTGVGRSTLTLASDATAEGIESLRVSLGNGKAQVDVQIIDTSVPVAPTYALNVGVGSQIEGGTLTYLLSTTQLAAGTTVAYSLSGVGITAADIVGGALSGFFTIDAAGMATTSVVLAADAALEGTEVLRLQLSGNVGQIDATILDTSVPPPPVGTADLLIIANAMNNSQAGPPPNPLAGEIALNTYLNADLLNQSGTLPLRMSVADLRATDAVAGAPLNNTNHSADRGNLAQISNPALFTFDLGGQIDRVDYSAESGRIVAIVSSQSTLATQFILVNDDATDNVFNQATDRIDTLKSVEEIVASSGGGVIDLSASTHDWTLTYGRNFNPGTDVDVARDREQRRIDLVDQTSGVALDRSFIEFRDAGLNPGVLQATAAWRVVEGSDHNETLIFTSAEAQDERASHLRGGVNSVKFNELTRSILVDLTITPWLASTNLADNSNLSGRVSAATTFTNGDGVTLLGAHQNVTSSHTPDNAISAGVLKIAGSQDAEDALSFAGTAAPKLFMLGQAINGSDVLSVRLVGAGLANAVELTGFELLRDNPASDDVFVINNIAQATLGSPKLLDAAGPDHDTIRLATQALGSAAVGGAVGSINLAVLNGASPGFSFDFDVLDLSSVVASNLTVIGTAGTDDELVVGALSTLGVVSQFEALVLTDASIDKGASLTLDLDVGAVKAGATKLFDYSGAVLSAGGTVFGSAGQPSAVAPMSSGVSLTVVDTSAGAGATLWGGAAADILSGAQGDDSLRGGGGNDTQSGGLAAETWSFSLSGTPDATALASNRIAITLTIDGTVLTLVEAAVVDTAYADGNGAVLDGGPLSALGQALASMVNVNLGAINSGPGNGQLNAATYNPITGALLLSFAPGVDANDLVSAAVNAGAGPDSGSFSLAAGPHIDGGIGGADVFTFEASGVLNGSDTLIDFTRLSDKLRVTAFTGGAINAASSAINAALGGTLAGVATTAELVFNKAGGSLSSADFSVLAATGKLVLADGARSVVAVTADPTGAGGDAANTAVRLYYVENGGLAGLSDLTVSLVATISGPQELSLADIFWGLG